MEAYQAGLDLSLQDPMNPAHLLPLVPPSVVFSSLSYSYTVRLCVTAPWDMLCCRKVRSSRCQLKVLSWLQISGFSEFLPKLNILWPQNQTPALGKDAHIWPLSCAQHLSRGRAPSMRYSGLHSGTSWRRVHCENSFTES